MNSGISRTGGSIGTASVGGTTGNGATGGTNVNGVGGVGSFGPIYFGFGMLLPMNSGGFGGSLSISFGGVTLGGTGLSGNGGSGVFCNSNLGFVVI